MTALLLSLAFLAGQCVAYGQPRGARNDLMRRDGVETRICYEYVVVNTYIIDATTTKGMEDNVVVTEEYTGTSHITAPITTTIAARGDEPATVIVEVPPVSSTTTVDEAYTGTSEITEPITTTIFPTDGGVETVIVETPPVKLIVTETELYTGTADLVEPFTTTISSHGASQETVIVELPTDEFFTTETEFYTGTSHITEPITTTVVDPDDDHIGTVIVEEPPKQTTEPMAESTTEPTSEPTSESTPEPTTSKPSTTPSMTPTRTSSQDEGPTFSCDEGGYLMQEHTLYRLDLTTGDNPVVNKKVGDGGNINAMGYNVLDNFLYAFMSIGNSQQQLIRIDAKGQSTNLDLVVESGLNVADIDNNGQMWVSERGSRWQQVDLDPSSDTFATVVDSGKSTGTAVADWVYLEHGGDYLYSIRLGTNAVAVRWSRTAHTWETLNDYGQPSGQYSGFGALYDVGRELWGSNNQNGDIIAFPVLDEGEPARKISDGPTTDSNDGARCFKAPAPE